MPSQPLQAKLNEILAHLTTVERFLRFGVIVISFLTLFSLFLFLCRQFFKKEPASLSLEKVFVAVIIILVSNLLTNPNPSWSIGLGLSAIVTAFFVCKKLPGA